MCPTFSDAEIEARIDELTVLFQRGDSRAQARDGVGGNCAATQATEQAATACGLCEATMVERIWGSDDALATMCPVLTEQELDDRTDQLTGTFQQGDSREDAYVGVRDACADVAGSVDAAVACGMCDATIIDRVWED